MADLSHNLAHIDPRLPDPGIIRRAANVLEEGGIVVFPTTGLYGLAADALNPHAVAGVFDLKQRPAHNPLLVLIKDRFALSQVVSHIPEIANLLMDRFWPGHLTLVMNARRELPPALTGGTGKIGVRVSAHPVASALVQAFHRPITGTSANISGQPGCSDIASLAPDIRRKADLILDAGTLKGGKGSTVVDVTRHPVQVIREGHIGIEALKPYLQRDFSK